MKVLYFSWIKDKLGKSHEQIQVSDNIKTINDLIILLKQNNENYKEVFKDNIGGIDPGAPKNPKIAKKFLITTIITSILFIVIYYLSNKGFLNLREYLQ